LITSSARSATAVCRSEAEQEVPAALREAVLGLFLRKGDADFGPVATIVSVKEALRFFLPRSGRPGNLHP